MSSNVVRLPVNVAQVPPRAAELSCLPQVRQLAAQASAFTFDDLEFGRESLESAGARVLAFLEEIHETLAGLRSELDGLSSTPAGYDDALDALWLIDFEIRHHRRSLATLIARGTNRENGARQLDAAAREPGDGLRTLLDLLDESRSLPNNTMAREAVAARQFLLYSDRRIEAIEALSTSKPDEAVRRIGTTLAWLMSRPGFRRLRAGDRIAFRHLHKRAFDWFENGGTADDARQLFQDLQTFSQLVLQINDRPALKEHDRGVVQEMLRVLRESENEEIEVSSLCTDLAEIEGRSPELDQLLRSGDADAGELITLLTRLERQLRASTAIS